MSSSFLFVFALLVAFLTISQAAEEETIDDDGQRPPNIDPTDSNYIEIGVVMYQNLTVENVAEYDIPRLPYTFTDTNPYLKNYQLRAHLNGHLAKYTVNMNKILSDWREKEPNNTLARSSILNIMQNLNKVSEAYKIPMTKQGGGYINHIFYFACMSGRPLRDNYASGYMLDDIKKSWGSWRKFKETFEAAVNGVFGSGYVWLCRVPDAKDKDAPLVVKATANQDSPISEGLWPIAGIDLWEHAYYLQYKFWRNAYAEKWWLLLDWHEVEKIDAWWKKTAPEKTTPPKRGRVEL